VLVLSHPTDAQTVEFQRGDADASGVVDISDAIFTLGHLFLGTRSPTCLDAADADDSGEVDISDPISLLSWLFLAGEVPSAPGPLACGSDPTEDALSCIYSPACLPAFTQTEALMVLVEYESTDGLVTFAFECQKRGIEPVVLAKAAFVAENADLFKALQRYGVEIVGWCGPLLWGMPYDEQRELVSRTKVAIEAATGSPLKAISTRLFATDATTCRIAEELGIPYVFARGSTGARSTVYKPAEHDVRIISVSATESAGWTGGSLSDWSIWARGGTPADLDAGLQDALRHDRIAPVSHTRLGGLKKAWRTVLAERLLDNPRVRFQGLEEFAAIPDVTLPLAMIPENRKNPYGPMEDGTKTIVNLQVTESRNDAEALESVLGELSKRGIQRTTIFAPKELAESSCDLLRQYDQEGYEVAAFGRFEDMSREAQQTFIAQTRESLAGCLGHPVVGWRASRFTQDQATNEILRDLGLGWHASFVSRRSFLPRHETAFSPYVSFEYGFSVVSMIGAEVIEGKINALCDTSLDGTVESAAEWSDVVKAYFAKHRDAGLPFLTEFHPYFLVENAPWWEAFLELATWLSEQDVEFLTTSEFIERCVNQYGPAAAPAVPYRDEPNVEKLWQITEFPEVPGSPTVGNRIVFYHNGVGPMCVEFLAFLETVDYPLEEHLVGEPGFWDSMNALKAEFGRSEGFSEAFGYFPIIFVKTKAYSGFDAAIGEAIRALIEG
jgi:hypothetical protein